MSDKLIRDELLRSHRYQSLSNDTTKLLFVHLLLSSDGLSNAEATSTAISLIMNRVITDAIAATLLTELVDHQLIVTYMVDGKRYAHIPRSRQRIRYIKGKHPRPPQEIEDSEIRALILKVGPNADLSRTEVRHKTLAVAVAVNVKGTKPSAGAVDNSARRKSFIEHWTAKAKALSMEPQKGESAYDFARRVQLSQKGKKK